ncbi:MAG TPA: B12-binding domain-containing radical SAM protein, partial [Syntrophomonas wolfei]|nr:B12-binding domain-containing radical SAM protein [Syntrophomonas wolfei]
MFYGNIYNTQSNINGGIVFLKDRLFRDILPRVAKPARYTGSELNMIKKDWEQAGVKMVFAFPDVYEV